MDLLKIAVPGPFLEALDYLAPKNEKFTPSHLGCRVKVPLRNKEVIGILVGLETQSSPPRKGLKQAIRLLDQTPVLTDAILRLMHWASAYYHHPLGEVMISALPTQLRLDKKLNVEKLIAKQKNFPDTLISEPTPTLNKEQEDALRPIIESLCSFKSFLLYGITGSGKTEIYLRAIEHSLNQGKQVLVLVPEIGLTPQTLHRFEKRFNVPIAVIHSGLSENEKLKSWYFAKENLARIIIGTRSAIFTPIPHLGLIIIDEEHDSSFKQQEGFRYSARDLALLRAQWEQVPIVLGSATPSLESLHKTQLGQYELLTLSQRAGNAVLPSLHLIDLRKKILTAGLAPTLINAMKTHLKAGNQVLLFLNRRGFSPRLLCHTCGFLAQCERCDAPLIYHQHPTKLRCHHCDFECPPYKSCPKCQSDQWLMVGQGTQKLESLLENEFPSHTIIRVDRDNTRGKKAMSDLLKRIQEGDGHILIGTQMLAKGHHFPRVTLVGLLDIDGGLSSADFRATERMAQLILQVAGRSGRAETAGEVYIQTHFPDHRLLQILLNDGYFAFAKEALLERAEAQLPPFQHVALLRAEAPHASNPLNFLHEVASYARKLHPDVKLLGPVAAPMEKRAGRFRAHLIFQSAKRSALHQVLQLIQQHLSQLKSAKKVRVILDVDPQDML